MIDIVTDNKKTFENLNLLYESYHSEMKKIIKKYNLCQDSAIYYKYGEKYEDIVISYPYRNDFSKIKHNHPVTVKVIMNIKSSGSESKLYYIHDDGYNSHVVFGNGIFDHVYIISDTEFNEHKLNNCLLMSRNFSELSSVKKDIIQNRIKFVTEEIKRNNEERENLDKNLSIINNLISQNTNTTKKLESVDNLSLEKTQIIEKPSKPEEFRRSSRNKNKYKKL